MDKYEYKVRADEIKSLIAEGEYAQAVKIADTIDWRRVKSVMMLCTISDLYKINRRYEDSRDILLLAYERHAGGRLIVYSLCELSIKLEEYVQAIEYYKEFVQLAPKDTGRYILQYKLYEAQEVSLEERIAVLEEFKKRDYREKWAYELAYLYHRVGLESKCVEECDEMFLWFGEGKYVLKALELKKLHQPLSEEQQKKYDEIKNGDNVSEPEIVAEGRAIQEEAGQETEEEDDDEFSIEQNILTDPTQEIPGRDIEDIQVKTVDVGQFNTLNLQKELAESMREFLESHPTEEMPVKETASGHRKMQEAEGEEISAGEKIQPDGEEAKREPQQEPQPAGEVQEAEPHDTGEIHLLSDEILVPEIRREEKPIAEEVFFGNTAEVNIEDVVSELIEQDGAAKIPDRQKDTVKKDPVVKQDIQVKTSEEIKEQPATVSEAAGRKPEANPALSNTGIIRTFHKPSGYDELLSQEYDGQLSFVTPEQQKVEKQITGQLSIDDIMSEWEKMKKENEQKMLEEIKERVHKQTNTLFADFDESTKSGLLEELENAIISAAIKEQRKKAESEKPKIVKSAELLKREPVKEVPAKESPEDTEKPEEFEEEKEPVSDGQETDADEITDDLEDFLEDDIPADNIPMETAFESDLQEEEDEPEGGEELPEDPKEQTADAEPEPRQKVRELSKSEKERFAPFIHHRRTRRQIAEAVDNISMASYTGNVVITGEEGTGTIALAKLLVQEIQTSDNNFSGRVAKISGDTMNRKDVGATLAKLEGGALIIEKASSLKGDAVDDLIKEMNHEDKGLVVILEDTKAAMNDFLTKYSELLQIFNLRVDVEALDDQTLVKYAKKYALEQEYSIDELGVLALHTRIADMQTSDHEVTLAEIEELVDEAIYYADKKTPKHYFDVLFGKRYDKEDMIVLRENDFMHY